MKTDEADRGRYIYKADHIIYKKQQKGLRCKDDG